MFKLEWNEGWRWLLTEGFAPLFGAAVLYVVIGLALYVVLPKTVAYSFRWLEWLDPLGWLYGVVILASQAGWRSSLSHEPLRLTLYSVAIGAGSLLLLIIAMLIRGQSPGWQPPRRLSIVSVSLAIAMLYVGYNVARDAQQGGCPCPIQPKTQNRARI